MGLGVMLGGAVDGYRQMGDELRKEEDAKAVREARAREDEVREKMKFAPKVGDLIDEDFNPETYYDSVLAKQPKAEPRKFLGITLPGQGKAAPPAASAAPGTGLPGGVTPAPAEGDVEGIDVEAAKSRPKRQATEADMANYAMYAFSKAGMYKEGMTAAKEYAALRTNEVMKSLAGGGWTRAAKALENATGEPTDVVENEDGTVTVDVGGETFGQFRSYDEFVNQAQAMLTGDVGKAIDVGMRMKDADLRRWKAENDVKLALREADQRDRQLTQQGRYQEGQLGVQRAQVAVAQGRLGLDAAQNEREATQFNMQLAERQQLADAQRELALTDPMDPRYDTLSKYIESKDPAFTYINPNDPEAAPVGKLSGYRTTMINAWKASPYHDVTMWAKDPKTGKGAWYVKPAKDGDAPVVAKDFDDAEMKARRVYGVRKKK